MDITLGYDPNEDRIWLLGAETQLYWLTRRLCRSFLTSAAAYLEQTVASSGLPVEAPPKERVKLDHQETLAELPDEQPPIQRNKIHATVEQTRSGRVVTQIDLVVQGAQWKLVLHTQPDQKDALAFNRLSLHRLLGALVGMTHKAGWDLAGVPEWLSGPEGA